MLLLAMQVNAQQQPSVTVNVNPKTSSTVTSSYSYTVNDVKNSVNVRYNDNANSQDVQDDTPMKTKSFTKAFSIDKSDKINLSNQFGSITIKTWDKNEIKVDADIKAYAKTEDEAQKLLDDVSINATKSGDLVSYKTEMGERNGNWGSSMKNGKTIWRREVKVHYTVYMPAGNSLTASQQYGNILIGDFSGPTSIKVQYGNFTAGELNNVNNYVNVQYGAANIKEANTLKVKHQYGSGVTIGTVGTLDIDVQYAAVNVTTIKGSAVVKHQYGRGITIGSVGNLSANAQYSTVKVGTLRGNLTSKQQYGKLIVDEVEGSKNIEVDAQYTDVDLGLGGYNGDLDVETSYGNFKYGSNVSVKREGGDDERRYSQNKKYTGQVGKGGTARISVNTQYGSVTFK
ncbi:hypothetical protein FA048_02485 [Pedobacter polaris]|uniref:Adhesin domain-containing protein n=1 Tax=Pedobacter polaris TaxID=2571273 RepID=A0A4U1CZJ8_9SPHI|nr:hypothetical protein FA048_02485 [Pedobacter polaris]